MVSVSTSFAMTLNDENGVIVGGKSSALQKNEGVGIEKSLTAENKIQDFSEKAKENKNGSEQNEETNTNDEDKTNQFKKETTIVETVNQNISAKKENTITKEILGKTITFEFKKEERLDRLPNDNKDIIVYQSEDNVVLKLYKNTKDVYSIDFYNIASTISKKIITEETAKEVARDFSKQFCDITKYDKCEIYYLKYNNTFSVTFRKTIKGFDTSQYVNIWVNGDSDVTYFFKSTDLFDLFEESRINVTEDNVKQQVKQSCAKDGKFFDCEIESMILDIKDSKVVMDVIYRQIDEQGNYIYENAYGTINIELE